MSWACTVLLCYKSDLRLGLPITKNLNFLHSINIKRYIHVHVEVVDLSTCVLYNIKKKKKRANTKLCALNDSTESGLLVVYT